MAVQVYKSTDAGAPGLNGLAGSLVGLLKACLVDGFGALPSAGWSMALDDMANHQIILRSDDAVGTGRYYRVRDDGNIRVDGSQSYTPVATFNGCESFADINNTVGNYPNLNGDSNTDLNMDTMRGLFIQKSDAVDASLRPWMVVADERTCYLFVWIFNTANDDPAAIAVDGSTASLMFPTLFGDFATINGTPDPHGACVVGGDGNASYITSGEQFNNHFAGCIGSKEVPGHFLNRSMEGGAGAIGFGKSPLLMRRGNTEISAGAYNIGNNGWYLPYPSPQAGGMMVSQVVLFDEQAAPEKADVVTDHEFLVRGFLRGLYSVPHTIDQTRPDNCGAVFDTFVIDGKTYLLIAPIEGSSTYTMAIDITGPW